MGETNDPQGDVKTPTGDKGQTPKEDQTFTQEQVDAQIAKAKSDATADYKRLEAEVKRSQSVAEGAIKRLKDIEDAQLRADEEAAKDDPEKLSAIQLRRSALKERAEVAEERLKVETDRAELLTERQAIRQHRADRLSEKYNVTTETLLKYGGDSAEGMEELAKSYGERTDESGKPKKGRMTEPPDKGKTKGAPGSQTLEELLAVDVKKLTYSEKLEHKKALEEATKTTMASGGAT